MIATPLTAIPSKATAPITSVPISATDAPEEGPKELVLSEGIYLAHDTITLVAIPSHPNFPTTHVANVLDTKPRPLIAGSRISGLPQRRTDTPVHTFNDVLFLPGNELPPTEQPSKSRFPAANGSARFKNFATGNFKAYVGGASPNTPMHTLAKENVEVSKKKKPKTNILKSNSSFISKVTTHESLSRYLEGIDASLHTVFINNSRGLLWYDFTIPGEAEQLSKVIFTKAHPLCHDINSITRSPTHLDLIVGFSTADVIWYEPLSQRYSHINKNGVMNPSAISSIQWLPGSENVFVAAHFDGSIVMYDKEREDAPFTSEEDTQPQTPLPSKGVRQPRLLIRKSSKSINQKTNPLAAYKVSKLRLTDLQCSPDGRFVAATSEDGTLRIIDLVREALIDLYPSYFGGMTCLAWSPDGRYIITGGQDDLVSLWSFEDRTIVARCEGHRSWLSALAFDPWRCDSENYRFGSVGEDRRLLLWDFSVGMMQQPSTPSIRPSISSSIAPITEPISFKDQANGKDGYDRKISQESSNGGGIAHVVEPRAQVPTLPPILSKELDEHPISWIGFTEGYVALCCIQGHIRSFARPQAQHGSANGSPGYG